MVSPLVANTDAGATVSDNLDTDLELVVENSVDASAVGVYRVKFNITDSMVTKLQSCSYCNMRPPPSDCTCWRCRGDHEGGADYTDAGATVTANLDSISNWLSSIRGCIKLGEYTITYNAVDAAGNASTRITRKVTVVDTTKPVITNGWYEIIHQAGIEFIDPGADIDNIDVDLEATVVVL